MNIAIVIESFFDGGAEMFAIRLANAFAELHNVFFIELHPGLTFEKRQIALLNTKKITLFQPSLRKGNNTIAQKILARLSFSNTQKLLKHAVSIDRQVKDFIKKNRITVVNSHSWDSDVFFAALKEKAGFKLVSSFHGHYDFLKDKRKDFRSLTAKALRNIDVVIYTSPQHLQTLNEFSFPDPKRKKIFYGLDVKLAGNITLLKPGEKLKLVMIARGIKEKGWLEAIESVIELSMMYPERLELNLVGQGEYLDFLKRSYDHTFLHFIGYKENVLDIIREAHIGLLPTYFVAESLPNTIIEYLLMGKPVISTNAGAIPDMLTEKGETAGCCLNIEDGKVQIKVLSAAIEKYLINPSIVAAHSALALEAAKKFSMEECVRRYEEAMQIKNNKHTKERTCE